MGSKWRKVKLALGMNLCVYSPRTGNDDDSSPPSDILSNAALLSPSTDGSIHNTSPSPSPTPGSQGHGFRLSKSLSRSSKVCVLGLLFFFSVFFFFCLGFSFFCVDNGFFGCWGYEKTEEVCWFICWPRYLGDEMLVNWGTGDWNG